MALKREKLVAEDIEFGTGTVQRTADDGSGLTGSQVNIEHLYPIVGLTVDGDTTSDLFVFDKTNEDLWIGYSGSPSRSREMKLYVELTTTSTNASINHYAISALTQLKQESNNGIFTAGVIGLTHINATGITFSGTAYGTIGVLQAITGNTITHSGIVAGVYGRCTIDSAGTFTSVAGVEAQGPILSGTATITTGYGLWVKSPTVTGGGTLTNSVGIKIESIANGANNWALQSAGGQSYHAGNLRIGAATAPVAHLDVTGQIAFTKSSAISFTSLDPAGIINFNNVAGELAIAANSTGGNTSIALYTSTAAQATMKVQITNAGVLRALGDIEIDGDLNHDGSEVGFFAVTPVARATAYTQTYSTADRTNAALGVETLTDNSGGTASTTLAAITGGGAGCEDATKNAVASLADQINNLAADMADVKQLCNSIIDDLQAYGLFQ